MTKEELEASIGKRVCVKTKQGTVCGVLQFAGMNEYLPSYGYQVTIDRLPVPNINPVDVSLQSPQWKIRKKETE